jgi:simple sugar transport system ATP-binding protein
VVPLLEVRMLDADDDRGLRALRRISLTVHGGEIVGIAGVEGNGQQELAECITGLRVAKHGTVMVQGKPIQGRNPRECAAAGLAHIPADRLHRGLVPPMSLAENLILGRHRERSLGSGPFLARRALAARAGQLLTDYDVRPPCPTSRRRDSRAAISRS